MNKTASGLLSYVKAQLGRPYWYGAYGQAANKALYNYLKGEYPQYYKWEYAGEIAKVHDCTGLVEGYLFCDSPEDLTPTYNPELDRSANETLRSCAESGDISTIPEIPGVIVFYNGHMGVYIGSGEVIEARGHKYGVVETKLSERPWTDWGKHPNIEYDTVESTPAVKMVSIALPVLKKGSKGDSVKAMQHLLMANGYKMMSASGKVYSADGSFGGATELALKAFQEDSNLEVDGSCGPKTWRKLLGVME